MTILSEKQWWGERAKECYDRGEHIPSKWDIAFDDGADGCMPSGWYLTGLGENGMSINWPIRHEYGPFKSWKEAQEHAVLVTKSLTDDAPASLI